MTSTFRYFSVAVLLLVVVTLLVMNDFASLWNGAEASLAWESAAPGGSHILPAMFLNWVWEQTHGNLFLMRLPSVLWLLMAGAGFFYLARPLFGLRTTVTALLVAGTSMGLPNLAKMATPDSWLFALHLIGFVLLLRHIKQPDGDWRWWFYAVVFASGLIAPWYSLVYFSMLATFILGRPGQARQLWRLQAWLPALLAVAVCWFSGTLEWRPDWFFVHQNRPGGYLLLLLGYLPFAGFILSGLRDYAPKLHKGDEMAVLIFAGFMAGMMAQSPAIYFVPALLIARQMDAYFLPVFPYRNFVKAGAVLHLIAAFFGSLILFFGGVYYLQGAGFRVAALIAGAYWSMSFVGVIGLYGMHRRWAIGGPILAGAFALLLFWLSGYPLLEARRKLELDLTNALPADAEALVYVQCGYHEALPAMAAYVRREFPQTTLVANERKVSGLKRPFYLISRTEIVSCASMFRADSTAAALRLYHCLQTE